MDLIINIRIDYKIIKEEILMKITRFFLKYYLVSNFLF